MGRAVECVKLSREGKISLPTPSCRELAERFNELQRLRQKVRAAEGSQSLGEQPPAHRC